MSRQSIISLIALCKPQIEYVTAYADSHWTSNLQSSVTAQFCLVGTAIFLEIVSFHAGNIHALFSSFEYNFVPTYTVKRDTYRIAGNFWGRKLVKIRFSRRKLSQIAQFCSTKGRHATNFAGKTFAYSHKTAKFTKVFSLESLPLHGTNTRYACIAHMMCDVQKLEGRLGRDVLLVNTWSEWIKSDFQLKCRQKKKVF